MKRQGTGVRGQGTGVVAAGLSSLGGGFNLRFLHHSLFTIHYSPGFK